MTSRATTTRRALSALALVVCLIGQLGGIVHRATVQHVTCEHGGLVELKGRATTAAPDRAIVASSSELHHAHCELCATLSCRGERQQEAAPATFAVARATHPMLRHRVVSVLAFAPKSSPPA